VVISLRLFLSSLLGFAIQLAATNPPATSYTIQTVAGSDFAVDGAAALTAVFSQTEGIAVDSSGAIYIADADGNRVRKVRPDGRIQTVAGNGVAGFSGDGGPSNTAVLSHPYGVAVDAQGNLYIADLGTARIRKISIDGTIRTVAGGGTIAPGGTGDGGAATSAQLLQPRYIAVDLDGTLSISDFGAHRVYRVTPGGILTTLAGTGDKVTTIAGSGMTPHFGGDNGPATAARLHTPSGLALDDSGNWYIADTANNRIRKVRPSAIITTIAGTGDAGSKGDNGPAVLAQLNGPRSVAVDSQHNIYIADSGNNIVRKITPGGINSYCPTTGK
jgi:sugar lactone lactonase YvrE